MGLDTPLGALLAFVVVAVPLSLGALGATGAVSMEGMVADGARHMLDSGELLVPRVYGEIYTYKPPMAYWLAALSASLFGDSLWALRLPSALASLGMGLVALLLIGRATRPLVGLVTAIGSISGVLYLQKIRLAEYDTVLAAGVGVAVLCAATGLALERPPSARLWLLGYLGLAVACLTKGVPALMAYAPGLAVAAVVTRRVPRLFTASHLGACTAFAVVVGGHLLLSWWAAGAAAFAQPMAEAAERGFHWTAEAVGTTLAKPILIWALFLPWSLVWFRRPASGARREVRGRLHLAGISFLGLGALAFVVVPTLECRYFLPLAAPAGLVAALALEDRRRGGARVRGTAQALLLAVVAAWSMETLVLRPHRASTRDLSTVAARLRPTIPPLETVWIPGPAVTAGKNSSLYYYLGRDVRTFGPHASLPSGAWVVLTRKASTAPAPACLRLLDEVPHERGTFALYRHSDALAHDIHSGA